MSHHLSPAASALLNSALNEVEAAATEQYTSEINQYFQDTLPTSPEDFVGLEHFKWIGDVNDIKRTMSTRAFNLLRSANPDVGVTVIERPELEWDEEQCRRIAKRYANTRENAVLLKNYVLLKQCAPPYGKKGVVLDAADFLLQTGSIINATPIVLRTVQKGVGQAALEALAEISIDLRKRIE